MNTPATKGNVKRYMLNNYRDHVDPTDGTINLTSLVEDCDMAFTDLNLDEVDGAWDWASEVADMLARAGKVNPIC